LPFSGSAVKVFLEWLYNGWLPGVDLKRFAKVAKLAESCCGNVKEEKEVFENVG